MFLSGLRANRFSTNHTQIYSFQRQLNEFTMMVRGLVDSGYEYNRFYTKITELFSLHNDIIKFAFSVKWSYNTRMMQMLLPLWPRPYLRSLCMLSNHQQPPAQPSPRPKIFILPNEAGTSATAPLRTTTRRNDFVSHPKLKWGKEGRTAELPLEQ